MEVFAVLCPIILDTAIRGNVKMMILVVGVTTLQADLGKHLVGTRHQKLIIDGYVKKDK